MVILVVLVRKIEDDGVLEVKRVWGERGMIRVVILRVCEREDEMNVDIDEDIVCVFCFWFWLFLNGLCCCFCCLYETM